MRTWIFAAGLLVAMNVHAAPSSWQSDLTTMRDVQAVDIEAAPGKLQGKAGLNVGRAPGAAGLLTIKAPDFQNGTIEIDIAGDVRADARPGARGFIGVAFRVTDPTTYEAIYLRPANGRADEQVRRNHTTQYISAPDYDFDRLRKEAPERYESYADIMPGTWTHMRIDVQGSRAELYVGDARQPALIVTDLKHGADAHGGIAIWVGPGTNGYVRNVKVRYR